MRDFFQACWGDLDGRFGEIRAIKNGIVRQSYHSSPETAESDALVLNSLGHDVYFGVLPRNEQNGRGDSIASTARVMWADFDAKSYIRPGTPPHPDDMFFAMPVAFRAMASIAPEPQIVVDSGHGYHAYWLLDKAYDFEMVREVMKGIAVVTGADPKTHDKARILRVPGTENHKNPDEVVPVRLLRFSVIARRHRLSDFVGYAEAGMPSVSRSFKPTWSETNGEQRVEGWEPSQPGAKPFAEGTRNNMLTQIAGIMYARGMTPEQVDFALHHENGNRCHPPLPLAEVDVIVKSVGRYAR